VATETGGLDRLLRVADPASDRVREPDQVGLPIQHADVDDLRVEDLLQTIAY
jgi:hypothetical protein